MTAPHPITKCRPSTATRTPLIRHDPSPLSSTQLSAKRAAAPRSRSLWRGSRVVGAMSAAAGAAAETPWVDGALSVPSLESLCCPTLPSDPIQPNHRRPAAISCNALAPSCSAAMAAQASVFLHRQNQQCPGQKPPFLHPEECKPYFIRHIHPPEPIAGGEMGDAGRRRRRRKHAVLRVSSAGCLGGACRFASRRVQ